jgi:hypothetical protein
MRNQVIERETGLLQDQHGTSRLFHSLAVGENITGPIGWEFIDYPFPPRKTNEKGGSGSWDYAQPRKSGP